MIVKGSNIVDLPDGEYRGLWSESIVFVELPDDREVSILVNKSPSKDLTPVVVVVENRYAVAETIFSEV